MKSFLDPTSKDVDALGRQGLCVWAVCLVARQCLTLWNPMDKILPLFLRNLSNICPASFLFSSSSLLTLCDPMDYSISGFPVLHHLPEFAQPHVRWITDAIQPSHPLFPPSLPALNLSHHQGLFQGVGSSHQEAKVLELQHQHPLRRNQRSLTICSPLTVFLCFCMFSLLWWNLFFG